jgi:hypothetical protein
MLKFQLQCEWNDVLNFVTSNPIKLNTDFKTEWNWCLVNRDPFKWQNKGPGVFCLNCKYYFKLFKGRILCNGLLSTTNVVDLPLWSILKHFILINNWLLSWLTKVSSFWIIRSIDEFEVSLISPTRKYAANEMQNAVWNKSHNVRYKHGVMHCANFD